MLNSDSGASTFTAFHKVDTLLANTIHSFLAKIVVAAISCDYQHFAITLDRDLVQDIYDYHEQMLYGYMHPRSDSKRFRALKLSRDWQSVRISTVNP